MLFSMHSNPVGLLIFPDVRQCISVSFRLQPFLIIQLTVFKNSGKGQNVSQFVQLKLISSNVFFCKSKALKLWICLI